MIDTVVAYFFCSTWIENEESTNIMERFKKLGEYISRRVIDSINSKFRRILESKLIERNGIRCSRTKATRSNVLIVYAIRAAKRVKWRN